MQKNEKGDIKSKLVKKPESEGDPDSFIIRAANILTCLSEGVDTVTRISRKCQLSTSTTHRILRTLMEPNIAVYDPSHRRYYLGPFLGKLARNPDMTHRILTISALGEMKRIMVVSEETVTLDSVIGIQFVHLHALHSKQGLKVQEDVALAKELRPVLPIGASQKILLAQLGEYELKMALRIAANWLGSDHTLKQSAIEDWKTQLRQIKQQGYIITRGESIPGGLGVSVPILNYINPVALTVLGPEKRMVNKVDTLLKELQFSSASLSKQLAELIPTHSNH
jgi:DNA-binding IclR family transcriptional regulator